ncbi:centromere protein P [Myripristis murdjan]|uniref:Centromere protein P n=1 Tax=Myripristis murdjan TaxID=586833 RepID=A0A667XY82_9TELE|nr:centromere protein P [Myripristis murdjan]
MENVDEVSVLQGQVQRLQAEVSALQAQQQHGRRDGTLPLTGRLQDTLAEVCGGAGGEEALSRLREEVQELERDLHRQTELNGFSLSSCSSRSLQHGGGVLVQQLCIAGSCSELDFQVEFQLTSDLKEDQRCERKVTELNVVMDASDQQALSSFVSGVEESRDLLLFFRSLRTFSERCNDRRRTFQHFQEKYPAVVSLPGGCGSEVMTLHHPELPGCVLLVHWSVEVSREGGVTSELDLLTKIPETALQMDSRAVGGAAEAFQSLLRILGPEAALESLIQAISA